MNRSTHSIFGITSYELEMVHSPRTMIDRRPSLDKENRTSRKERTSRSKRSKSKELFMYDSFSSGRKILVEL